MTEPTGKVFTPEQKEELKKIATYYGLEERRIKLAEVCAEFAAEEHHWIRNGDFLLGEHGGDNGFYERLAALFVVLHEIKFLLFDDERDLIKFLQIKTDREIKRQLKVVEELQEKAERAFEIENPKAP